ncbi:MAG TPA: PQQ-binding-like beta-propeller repeat protein [Puia sp.]|nr:PQQ-binding-like beta-propeller repeat protein [Puia sp.]
MRTIILFAVILCCSCCNRRGNESSAMAGALVDTFRLPGIPDYNTLHFTGNLIYYEAGDSASPYSGSIRCFSLTERKLRWSKPIGAMGINEGAITSTGEYVVPALTDTVYLFDSSGSRRTLKLVDRCKTNPFAFRNSFILQDRGVGLKCFDARTLQQLWLIPQNREFTMPQPILIDSTLIYVMDDKVIEAANAADGRLRWKVPVLGDTAAKWKIPRTDTFGLYDLYGRSEDAVFVLSIDLKDRPGLFAINFREGKLLWTTAMDTDVDVWERSMVVRDDTVYCKGQRSIIRFGLKDGAGLGRYRFDSRVVTNLIKDGKGNILFGLEDHSLMEIGAGGGLKVMGKFARGLNRFYRNEGSVYLMSYPELYKL